MRTLWKNKVFTSINLLGLSIGIAAVVLLFMIADYEQRFDKLHSRLKDIYRIVNTSDKGGEKEYQAGMPFPTAKLLRMESPGITTSQIAFFEDVNIRIAKEDPFEEKNVLFADSVFFKVFDFAEIKDFKVAGNFKDALSEPNKAVLTEATAKRYFGSSDPIGKVIKLNALLDVQITAIIKDPPTTTHLPFTMIVSYPSLTKEFMGGFELDNWGMTMNGYCYVKLDNTHNKSSVERALASINNKNSPDARGKRESFHLQALNEIHFDQLYESSSTNYTVSHTHLMMILLLGGFIMLIACVNYINLSTSLAFSKSKEIGIRKTIGASKKQLFFQYMSETFVVTTLATILGIALAVYFLPVVNTMLAKSISISQLATTNFIAGAVVILVIVTFISGIYPALVLSGFKPVESLKNQLALPGKSSNVLRKSLVVFQFTTSIVLIICTIVIAKQMNYFNSKSLGFNKDAVVEISLPSADSAGRESFKNLLNGIQGIQNVSFCLGAPISSNGINTSLKAPQLSDKMDYSVKILACDSNYLNTYGFALIAGRWFMAGEEKNTGTGVVVNESLIKTLGFSNPADALGKKIRIGVNDINPAIIGVVKNFHTSSLHKTIEPVALMPFPPFYFATGIRIHPANISTTLPGIEASFKKVYPESVYQLTFIDDNLKQRYEQESRHFNLFKSFSSISIFICCIGLWGMIAFVVVRKTKEIGIRKILGAKIFNIVSLISKDFLKLILIALLIASPIAYYFMKEWLENFAYRIAISWWVFGLAGLVAVVIALLTISYQAVKAAVTNPVKNLRTE